MTIARSRRVLSLAAVCLASACAASPSNESRLDLRNAGSIPVGVFFRGARITIPPGGELSGLDYEKGDAVEVLQGRQGVGGVALAARTVLDGGPAYVLLTPEADGNVGIAESSRPITVVETR